MRGEFISVWSDTWDAVWAPLVDQDYVPQDIFCELYRVMTKALKDPSGEEAIAMVLADAILLRESFENSLTLAHVEIELTKADLAFETSGAISTVDVGQRKAALQNCLSQLIANDTRSDALLTEALTALAADPLKRSEAKARAVDNIVNDANKSREAFRRIRSQDLTGERALVEFLELASDIMEDVGGDLLANNYFNFLTAFIEKFSLRYDLRRPCTLCPTLPGMFVSLMRDLQLVTSRDPHLDSVRKDFEDAIRDLRIDCSDSRIRNCIQKQVVLLEALGQCYPGVTKNTLGAICGQVGTWPHGEVLEAIKNLYKFTNSYPGIRHAGTPATALRVIDMRDLVAVSILLAGFTPYLSDQLNADIVYRGV